MVVIVPPVESAYCNTIRSESRLGWRLTEAKSPLTPSWGPYLVSYLSL